MNFSDSPQIYFIDLLESKSNTSLYSELSMSYPLVSIFKILQNVVLTYDYENFKLLAALCSFNFVIIQHIHKEVPKVLGQTKNGITFFFLLKFLLHFLLKNNIPGL